MYYFAFNLKIKSDLKLDRAQPIEDCFPDVQIYKSNAAYNESLGFQQASFWSGDSKFFSVYVPNIAYFKIVDGNTILYHPDSTNDYDSIALFILGTCMGALLSQRKKLVLHANAIKVGDHAVLFSGPSGIGKSTLAAAFSNLGYPVLADDLAVIDENNQVSPSYPFIKLWQDTSDKMGITTTELRRVRPQIEKFELPVHHSFYQEPLPVKSVFFLNTHNKDTFEIEEITGFGKIPFLKNNTYRINHIEAMGLLGHHLKASSHLANHSSLYKISRPENGFMIEELIRFIQNYI